MGKQKGVKHMDGKSCDLCENLESIKCYVDYWNYIVSYLYKAESINKECYRRLTEILTDEEMKETLHDFKFNVLNFQIEVNGLQKSFEMLRDKHIRRDTGYLGHPDGQEFDQKHAVNTKKYVDRFYNSAPFYIVLHQMFRDCCPQLHLILEEKRHFQRFGKRQGLYGDYYCISPIIDLIVFNAARGDFYKRPPKDLTEKIEYVYDESGRLLMCMWYRNNDSLYTIELFLYSELYIIRLAYDSYSQDDFRLGDIVIQTYQGELISSLEHTYFSPYGIIWEMETEKYIYIDGKIGEEWEEHYIFPGTGEAWFELVCPRNQRIFEWNSDGYIYGFRCREWLGDGLIRNTDDDHICEISDKKKKTTGKEAGRWRRPNYFRE